jgi:hypothetical protein
MVRYICVYCKKEFNKKHNHNIHTNGTCKQIFDNIVNYYKKLSKSCLISDYFKYNKKITNNYNNISNFRCKTCKRIFSRFDNLNRHLKISKCKINDKKNIINKKTTNNITNNNIINNTTNNHTTNITINLIPFDSVRYENLPFNLRKNLLETPGLSIQKLILYEHFNKNKPNQLNILYCNRRDSKMLIYDKSELSNNGWSTRNKDEICEIILNKAMYAIEDVINDNDENNNNLQIKDYKIDAITRLIKEIDNEKKFRKEIKENIYDICYDNNYIVKNNKNKLITN